MRERISNILTLILLPGLILGFSPLHWFLKGMGTWPKPTETWEIVKTIPRGYLEVMDPIWPPKIYTNFQWSLFLTWETWHFLAFASIPLVLVIFVGKFLQACNNGSIIGQIVYYFMAMGLSSWGLSLV